jgi:hypothetical protein
VLVFDAPGRIPAFRDSLNMYSAASPNIQPEYVDMDREPARAREYPSSPLAPSSWNTGGRREKVMSDREQELTNTLIKVTTGRQMKAYFVSGPRRARHAWQRSPRVRERRRRLEAR